MTKAGRSSPPVVVLTGGIASGKSAVSEQFSHLGIPVIDTDLLAREAVAPGSPGLAGVVSSFGNELLRADGSLDRARLRERVFADPQARKQLEALLHPKIESAARARLAALKGAPYCLLVVPLLVETGLFADADKIVVVDVPETRQIERLKQRDGIDQAAAERMLAAQASRQQRLAQADEVIENDGSLDELRARVNSLHQRLLARLA